jgi:NAD(P)H-flavin reductase
VPICSNDPDWGGEMGTISDVVSRFGPWREHDFFVSGSPAMIRASLRALTNLQVPHTRIRYDAFSAH